MSLLGLFSRLLLVVSCLLLLVVLSAGCGTGSTSSPTSTSTAISGSGGGTGGGTGGGAGGGANRTPTASPTTAPSVSQDVLFTLILPDGKTKGLTRKDMTSLPMSTVIIEGIPQEGPLLQDVLRFAGATDFNQVTISGVWDNKPGNARGAPGSITLTKDQITRETLLDFANNRPTMKFASPAIPKPDWVQDIRTIKVE